MTAASRLGRSPRLSLSRRDRAADAGAFRDVEAAREQRLRLQSHIQRHHGLQMQSVAIMDIAVPLRHRSGADLPDARELPLRPHLGPPASMLPSRRWTSPCGLFWGMARSRKFGARADEGAQRSLAGECGMTVAGLEACADRFDPWSMERRCSNAAKLRMALSCLEMPADQGQFSARVALLVGAVMSSAFSRGELSPLALMLFADPLLE